MRDPWDVSEAEFPAAGDASEQLRFLLHYAVLAPSSHNTQPWRFRVGGNEVLLFADRTRALPVVDPDDRELTISCGAALFHLRIALRHFGYRAPTQLLPHAESADVLARVQLGERQDATPEEHALFYAIPQRRTNRLAFEPQPLPDLLLAELQAAAHDEGAWLHIVTGEPARNAVADLIAEGDRIQMADRRFRRELASWLHASRSASHDGIPAYAYGVNQLLDFATPAFALVIRTFDMGKGIGAADRDFAAGSPLLAVLGTDTDDPLGWLTAGQAMARALLHARAKGVWTSFLNPPIEVEELRPRLLAILGRAGHPQLVLRMGYGTDVKPTPRRPVGEVLL